MRSKAEAEIVPENSDAKKMERALSGAFGSQWEVDERKRQYYIFGLMEAIQKLPESEREAKLKMIADWLSDRRLLIMNDFTAEAAFREEAILNINLFEDPIFLHEWDLMRDIQTARGLQNKSDAVSTYAVLFREEPKEVPSEKEMFPYYFGYFERLGPERSGQLEEVIGPMGSGKSNFLAWKAIKALQRGHVVMTNFSLKNVPQSFHSNWKEVHSYIDLFAETVKLKKDGYNGLVFWIIDEQGRTPGGTSQTVSMREGRWSSELLTIVRKFGVFVTRARQTDNIPQDQMGWVSFIIEKNVKEPEVVTVSKMHNGMEEERYSFTISSMRDYYNTNDPCLISMDLDMEMLQKYATRKQQKGMDAISAIDDFLSIARKLDDAAWKKFEANIDELESGIDEAIKEDRRGKSLNSIKNLKQYSDKLKNTVQSEKK